jgi:hypothetical protein
MTDRESNIEEAHHHGDQAFLPEVGREATDWETAVLFKLYPTLPVTPLPGDVEPPDAEALAAISVFDAIGDGC